jgi:AcrR family transcriptional regulator
MTTQSERREATRSAIIVAATELFGKGGFAATTVDAIGLTAQVAKGGVYHHFPTKESIFEVVFDTVSGEIAKRVRNVAREAPDVLAALALGTRAYLEAVSKGAARRIVLADGPAVLGWQRWRELDDKHFGGVIPKALTSAMMQGLIPQQQVEPLARLLLGAITEAAFACAASPSRRATGRQYAAAFDALLAGLRPPRPASE